MPQGVGSHAAHMLLRSGVGRLRLIDFDQVTLSSLNRHATATRKDVGLPKATCLQVASWSRSLLCCCAPCNMCMLTSLLLDGHRSGDGLALCEHNHC